MAKRKLKKNIVKKFVSSLFYVFGVLFICAGVIGLISLDKKSMHDVSGLNSNLEKTVSTKDLMTSYKKLNEKRAEERRKAAEPIIYNNFIDAITNAKNHATSFVGKLVHYGPDCPECSGRLGCNGQDARNGNIYYNDKQYGKVRIVATSASIPCGSIIRINVSAYDKNGLYAIVLDRGVSGPMVDLLKPSAKSKTPVATTDGVKFDILRYGY